MEYHKYELPVEEAVKIQEALKPLGYVVHKYSDGWISNGVELTLYKLDPKYPFPWQDKSHTAQ